MGLDTTHDAWHGSYGSFHAFREAVSAVAGYGSDIRNTWKTVEVRDWTNGTKTIEPTEEMLWGKWPSPPSDPIMYLLQHADNEGSLPVNSLVPLAERLEELAVYLEGRWADNALQFAAGCRTAAAANEEIEFW